MLSTLELRHIIESAFLPLECTCEAGGDFLTIAVKDKNNRELHFARIPWSALADARSISQLITSIKDNLPIASDLPHQH